MVLLNYFNKRPRKQNRKINKSQMKMKKKEIQIYKKKRTGKHIEIEMHRKIEKNRKQNRSLHLLLFSFVIGKFFFIQIFY